MKNDARCLELRWNGVPEEVKDAISPLIHEHMWIIPSWVDILIIEFVAQSDNTSLQIKCVEEYRTCYLNVMPNWLAQDPQVRSRDVVHEFSHVLVNPLHAFGLSLMDSTLSKGSALEMWAQEQLRIAVEKATCDIEIMLQRRAGPA